MESSLLAQGTQLMLVGMGTVFVFLTTLVAATSVMSSLTRQKAPAAETDGSGPTTEEMAAISAAISEYRRQ